MGGQAPGGEQLEAKEQAQDVSLPVVSERPAGVLRHERHWLWQLVALRAPGRLGRRVALLAGGAGFGRAVTIIAAPVLTRLYTPDDFGVLAVYTALLGIVGGVLCLRYELAIPIPASDRIAAHLLILCLCLGGAVSLSISLVVWALGGWLVPWDNSAALRAYLWILPIGFAGVATHQALSYWSIRKQEVRSLAQTHVASGAAQVVVQVGGGLLGSGPIGLLLGVVAFQAAGVATLVAPLWRRHRGPFRAVGITGLRRVLRRYRRFPLYSTGSALLDGAARWLPAVLLAALYGLEVAGWYGLAQRMVDMPMSLLGSAVHQVYVGEATTVARTEPHRLGALLRRATSRLLLLGGLPFAIVALGGPWLFEAVFGAEWATSGHYARALACMYFAQFAVGPTSSTLYILDRQDWHLWWDAAKLMLVVLVFCSGHLWSWSPTTTVAGYGGAMTICYVIFFAMMQGAVRRFRVTRRGRFV